MFNLLSLIVALFYALFSVRSFVWENLGGFAGWETDLRQDALPRLISQGNLHTKPRKLEQKQQWTSSSSFYEQRKIAQSHSKSNFYCRKKYYYRDYKMVAYRKPWKKLRTVQWNRSEIKQNQSWQKYWFWDIFIFFIINPLQDIRTC